MGDRTSRLDPGGARADMKGKETGPQYQFYLLRLAIGGQWG